MSNTTKFNLTSNPKDFQFFKEQGSPSRTRLRDIFGHAKPTRHHQRLLRVKTASTGNDPAGALKEFIGHDIIKPLERREQSTDKHSIREMLETRSGKWALNTCKISSSPERLPNFQPFKTYYFPKITENKSGDIPYMLPTDHISQIPNMKKTTSISSNFIEMKNRFSISTTNIGNSWVPQGNHKTMNNTSSVEYNILSPLQNNTISGAIQMKVMDKKIAAKKKGVGEFSDLTRPYNPNYFKQYQTAINDNINIFKKYNGIFSYLYESAHKNGNIVVPFSFEKDKATIQKQLDKRSAKLASLKEKFAQKNKPVILPKTDNSTTVNIINQNSNFLNNNINNVNQGIINKNNEKQSNNIKNKQ